MSIDDDRRLVNGQTIREVLAEDERHHAREREAEDVQRFEGYMEASFGLGKPPEPTKPKPDSNSDPDLHAGPRQPASDAADDALEAYMRVSFPQLA